MIKPYFLYVPGETGEQRRVSLHVPDPQSPDEYSAADIHLEIIEASARQYISMSLPEADQPTREQVEAIGNALPEDLPVAALARVLYNYKEGGLGVGHSPGLNTAVRNIIVDSNGTYLAGGIEKINGTPAFKTLVSSMAEFTSLDPAAWKIRDEGTYSHWGLEVKDMGTEHMGSVMCFGAVDKAGRLRPELRMPPYEVPEGLLEPGGHPSFGQTAPYSTPAWAR